MKSYIEEPDSASIGYGKRLNSPVKVLVIDGVLIVPKVLAYVCDFVRNVSDAIVSRIGLDLNHRGASVRPSYDGGSHRSRGSFGP